MKNKPPYAIGSVDNALLLARLLRKKATSASPKHPNASESPGRRRTAC
jgi:hypothetical protein